MIALDVESSGLDPTKASILSIGAVDTDDPTNQFYEECRIWDGAHIDEESLAVNGFTKEEATDPARKTEGELLEAFIAWATDRPRLRTLVAQNPVFDTSFIRAGCARAGLDVPFPHRLLDVHTLTWLHMTLRGVPTPEEKQRSAINLDFALRYCGIPEEPKPHNALTGALCHAEVFARIAYTKKLLPEFEAYDIPWLTN